MSDEVETWNGPFHRRLIAKGEYGELSKVREEVEEGLDALEQGQLLMFSVELSDILGALNGVAEKHFDKTIEEYLDPNFEPVLNELDFASREAYIEKSKNLLEMLEHLLKLSEVSEPKEDIIKGILQPIVIMASRFNLSFKDLNDFAILRSKVARHAIENS
mgnify:CR=1 FL=1